MSNDSSLYDRVATLQQQLDAANAQLAELAHAVNCANPTCKDAESARRLERLLEQVRSSTPAPEQRDTPPAAGEGEVRE